MLNATALTSGVRTVPRHGEHKQEPAGARRDHRDAGHRTAESPDRPSRHLRPRPLPCPAETTSLDRKAAHEWLAGYVPADLDDKTWGAVRGFVVECAARLIDEHGVSHGALRRKYVRALTKLARYCRSTHQQLNVKTALDPYTVNQFAAAVATVEPASAATYQSHLRYIGERLCPSPLWERPVPVGRRTAAVPSSKAELEALESQIARKPTSVGAVVRGCCTSALAPVWTDVGQPRSRSLT